MEVGQVLCSKSERARSSQPAPEAAGPQAVLLDGDCGAGLQGSIYSDLGMIDGRVWSRFHSQPGILLWPSHSAWLGSGTAAYLLLSFTGSAGGDGAGFSPSLCVSFLPSSRPSCLRDGVGRCFSSLDWDIRGWNLPRGYYAGLTDTFLIFFVF